MRESLKLAVEITAAALSHSTVALNTDSGKETADFLEQIHSRIIEIEKSTPKSGLNPKVIPK